MDTISLFGASFLGELEKIAGFRVAGTTSTRPLQVKPAPTPSFRVKTASTQPPPSTPTQTPPPTLGQRLRAGAKFSFKKYIVDGQQPTVPV